MVKLIPMLKTSIQILISNAICFIIIQKKILQDNLFSSSININIKILYDIYI